MAFPDGVEALLEHCSQAGVQRVDHHDGRRVVIATRRAADVGADEPQVEVPRLRWMHAVAQPVHGALPERERREPGRDSQALLGAGVAGVDPPSVDIDWNPGQRRDGVDDEERVGIGYGSERRDVVLDAGRRLGVHHRDQPGVRVLALGVDQLMRIEGTPPRLLDADDLGAATAGDVGHSLPEHAVHADDGGVTRLEKVDEARLHAGRSGAADGQCQRVLGEEDAPQSLHRLVEQREELGIEVPEDGTGEGRDGFRVRVRRAGAEEETFALRHAGNANAPAAPYAAERPTSGAQSTSSMRTSARASSPATSPRATSAAARATWVTSSSGRRIPCAAAICRTVCVTVDAARAATRVRCVRRRTRSIVKVTRHASTSSAAESAWLLVSVDAIRCTSSGVSRSSARVNSPTSITRIFGASARQVMDFRAIYRAERLRTSPSRMSASDTSISLKSNVRIVVTRISVPPTITSTRPGSRPGLCRRWS